MANSRSIDEPLTVSEIEALAVAAQRVVEEFKMGRMSLQEMRERFWRCVSRLPPIVPDEAVPGGRTRERVEPREAETSGTAARRGWREEQ